MGLSQLSWRGGDRLRSHLQSIAQGVERANTVRVGFLEGATYPDGTRVAAVAFWNEFGTVNAPPRPFFRRMIAKHSKEWGGELAKILKANNYAADRSLGLIGTRIKDELVTSINELTDPPLAASTVRRKGFDKPLIDTGVMLRAPDYEVR